MTLQTCHRARGNTDGKRGASRPLVSVIINNFNYAQFLGRAIDSALNQTYAPIEVIVVDDGSTDDSRHVIAQYGCQILPVLKENGGQVSAFNSGIASSHGEIICLLDSDDVFYPDKIAQVVNVFSDTEYASKSIFVSHGLELIDYEGAATGGRVGSESRGPLNLYNYAKRYKFTYSPCGPTTGMSLNRALARKIFPLPEGLKVAADDFVRRAASLIGDCYSISSVLGGYRIHGSNTGYGTAEERTGPPGHFRALEIYLNKILVQNNLEPVISFRDSIYFCAYLVEKGRWGELPRQVLRSLVRHPELHTVRFMYLLAVSILQKSRRGRMGRAQAN